MAEPSPAPFRMQVEDVAGVHVVRLFGELDVENADDVKASLVGTDAPFVVADLSGLEFIDSLGLSALCTARHQFVNLGKRFEMRGAAGPARRVFEAAGLEDVLDD